MADGAYLIGIDVGTTAVKGGLFDRSGRVLAHHAIPYPTLRPQPQRAEQDPDRWTAAIDEILAILLRETSPDAVAALGLCSQVNTHVFVDAAGTPLLPAIVWQDGRCAETAAELGTRTDIALPIGATNVLARMAWVARHHPSIWDRTALVLSPKDYCLLKLTGTAATDPLSSFDIVDANGRYIPQMLDLVPGAAERLPPIRPIDAVIGPLRTPQGKGPAVVNGTMDGWACLPGAGVSQPGEGAYISGTSEIIALASDRGPGAPGIVSFMPVGGWHVHAGPTQSGGDSLRWFAEATGHDAATILHHAARPDRADSRLIFLPHLGGERAPLWDPHSRGAFVGMSAGTGLGELTVAVMEGVAYSARLLFEAVSAAAGLSYESLYLAGGGARSDLWCQIRADILGVELARNAFLDSGTLGAAAIAGLGVGLFPSLGVAARGMRQIGRRFTPNPELKPRYDELFQRYGEIYRALSPIHRQLNLKG